jgi:hypothetical protein
MYSKSASGIELRLKMRARRAAEKVVRMRPRSVHTSEVFSSSAASCFEPLKVPNRAQPTTKVAVLLQPGLRHHGLKVLCQPSP